jgi:hypothetical protein
MPESVSTSGVVTGAASMNDLEKMVMKEISTLDEMRLIDVLGFIRYLKMGKTNNHEWVQGWFEEVLKTIHKQRGALHITPEEIKTEILKMRDSDSPNG